MVIGGLGGLGRSVIAWMAEHGARSILTLSRSGAQSEEAVGFVAEMKQKGVSLIVKQCDIASRQQLQDLLTAIGQDKSIPSIRGVIHSAMALQVSRRSMVIRNNTRR